MQNLQFGGVALYVLEHGLGGFFAHADRQDVGVEGFVLQVFEDLVVRDLQHPGFFAAAVKDGRDPVFATQAAARTRSLYVANLGVDFKTDGHDSFSMVVVEKSAEPATRSDAVKKLESG